MKDFTINDIKYSLKQNLKDMTVKDYFDIMKIQSERCEKPVREVDRYIDGTYDKEYYETNDEPLHFKWKKNNRIMSILSGVPLEYFDDSLELGEILAEHVEGFEYDKTVWKSKKHIDTVSQKVNVEINGKVKTRNIEVNVESDTEIWTYDKATNWCFQQWVDSENASKQEIYFPFIIAVTKKNTSVKTQRNKKYDRTHPDFDDKLTYWMNQPAYDNISTIINVLDEMSKVREKFFWIYEFETAYPEPMKATSKVYNNFAGWNDVVVSLSKTNAFNSPSGTLNAVRTANCIEVLEYLNWERGKSAAEYEDYKEDEKKKELGNLIG
jgi:hypothetical protein